MSSINVKEIPLSTYITIFMIFASLVWSWRGFVDTDQSVDELREDVRKLEIALRTGREEHIGLNGKFEARLTQLEHDGIGFDRKFQDNKDLFAELTASLNTLNTSIRAQTDLANKGLEDVKIRLSRIECIVDETCRPNPTRRPSGIQLGPH